MHSACVRGMFIFGKCVNFPWVGGGGGGQGLGSTRSVLSLGTKKSLHFPFCFALFRGFVVVVFFGGIFACRMFFCYFEY